MKRVLASLLALFWVGSLSAASPQIEFIAPLVSVEVESPNTGLLTLQLTTASTIGVRVAGLTDIRDDMGDPIGIQDLQIGDLLRVEGLFTEEGVLARRIEIVDPGDDFSLRGRIEQVLSDPDRIVVLGFTILVPTDASIVDADGADLGFEDLEVDMLVRVRGNVVGDDLVASSIRVLRPHAPATRISFEGLVVEFEEGVLLVRIDNLDPTVVHVDEKTEVMGEIVPGVRARVIGVLNEDLSVQAHRVIVLRLFQLAPAVVRMGPEETRRVQIVLLGSLEIDLNFSLASADPDVAMPAPESLEIPAGERTASFLVMSGSEGGNTEIEVWVNGLEEGHKAILPVHVRSKAPAPQRLRLQWAPAALRLRMNSDGTSTLRINQAAPEDLIVSLSQTAGSSDLVSFPDTVIIPEGSREVRVEFSSGEESGTGGVRAVLPEEFGGASSDLRIIVERPSGGPVSIGVPAGPRM